MLADDELAAVTLAYQSQLQALADAAGGGFRRAFIALGSYDRADMDRWLTMIDQLVLATGEAASAAAVGYTATITETTPAAVTAAEHAYLAPLDAPFLKVWHQLKAGQMWIDAVQAGADTATGLGMDTTQRSARHAAGRAAPDGVVGWRRVLTGKSCEWCALVSTQRYRSQDSATFGHSNCDCSVVSIIGDSDPGRVINGELLDRLTDDNVGNRIYDNRLARNSDRAADNAARRRDDTLNELTAEADPARRRRLTERARRWDQQAQTYRARAAEQRARPQKSRPDGVTGYVDPSGVPVPRP